MKEFISKYQKTIVGTGALAVLVICYFQQKELTKLRSEQNVEVLGGGDIQKEELRDSLFILQSNLGRYEMALEILREDDSLSAQKFEQILDKQTE
jgi:hypothetical protein